MTNTTTRHEAVIYARSATGGNEAIFQQVIELLIALAASPLRVHVREIYCDPDVADESTDQPSLRRLLADIRRQPVACLVIADRTRLSYNTAARCRIEHELTTSGVRIVCGQRRRSQAPRIKRARDA